MTDVPLRRLYADICRGYSVTSYDGAPVYLKHLSVFDQTEIDETHAIQFERAANRGIKTEAQKLKWLETKGLWRPKDEADLASQRSYVETLEKTKSKLGIKSQIDQLIKQIDEARTKLAAAANRRERYIGLTAEHIADKRTQYEYIRLTFYADSELRRPLFDEGAIGQLTDEQADLLLTTYILIITQFTSDAFRRIAISRFFTDQFYLCADRQEAFFGRPMVDLTLWQTALLSWGQRFYSIMTQNDLPKEVLSNPDKIEDYVNRSRNLKSLVSKSGPGDRVAIIGASADDFKAMGVEDGGDKVRADIRREVKSGIQAAQTREVAHKPR